MTPEGLSSSTLTLQQFADLTAPYRMSLKQWEKECQITGLTNGKISVTLDDKKTIKLLSVDNGRITL